MIAEWISVRLEVMVAPSGLRFEECQRKPVDQSPVPQRQCLAGRFSRGVSTAAAVLLFLCVSGGPSQTSSSHASATTSVLLITVDTLRADRLSCYGARSVRTPAMDALAAQGTRFENVLAQVPTTPPSHAVILTGTYPMYNGVRGFTSGALPKGVGVLAEAFQRHGYDTAAFVSSAVLESSWGFGRGFKEYDDRFTVRRVEIGNPAAIERRAEETVDRLLAWLQARLQSGTAAAPFFVWLHLYDPHAPYDPPEPFRTQYAGHRYDGEIAYADSQLARLFDYLRDNRLYDQTLIVLMSDHGESLGEHGEDEHGFFIYESTLRVPLIFKLPSGMGTPHVDRRLVGSIDVAPTLLDLLHMQDPLGRQFQGTSLAAEILGKGTASERPVYSETYYPRDSFGWSELRGITTERFKYILAPRPELYDLRSDPQESHNVHTERASLAAALRDQLTGFERRYASTRPTPTGPPLPAETVEKLKSLGYLAYVGAAQPAANGPLPDPKDRLKVFKSVMRAHALNEAGHYEESNRVLEPLAAEEAGLFVIPFLKAENYSQTHRWSEAEKSYQDSLKINPTFDRALMGLARSYMAQGEEEKAKPLLELVVHQNPRNNFATHALGRIARIEGNNEEAYRYLLKAAEAMPSIAIFQQELGITLVDLKRYQAALDPLSRAEKLGLEDPRLEHYLGTALANVGRFQEAVDHYQKALKMKPDLLQTRLSVAFAYLNLGDRDDAKREFQSLCQQSSSLCERYRKQFE
jgi:arylsulfatase A-like enzyme/tetratricopeptide (TPR) repeat protein